MSESQIEEIQNRLDNELSIATFERDYRTTEEAATEFFQDLFVEVLNYEETPSPLGDANWQNLPVHEWPSSTRSNAARLFAESGNFRVIYVELEKLTKTAERNVVQSLTRSERTSGWALAGSFIAVFHAPEGDVWHLITPYEEESNDITEGRSVIRRYTIGEGETHHTVSEALSQMDAGKPGRLADRIDEAFKVQPVTEDFYEDYKKIFGLLRNDLREEGLDLEVAKQYSHITLNRLMFLYFIQKKKWIAGRKDFVGWFYEEYDKSTDEGVFHEKWLSTLFFEGMSKKRGTEISQELPVEIKGAIQSIPYMNGGLFERLDVDENDSFISDSIFETVINGFLERYNFTITEESPYDIDVAVDPAMLGKIYESLIAEEERGKAGIFYTPRTEVDLMCRMAIYEQFPTDEFDAKEGLEFIFSEPDEWRLNHDYSDPKIDSLKNWLKGLDAVDPACGSGAFLVGLERVLIELYTKLGVEITYGLREAIVEENLYGVDVKGWAIRVAEFRLWLSLVESEDELPEQRPVLPNFRFKLRKADSLVQKLGEERLSFDQIVKKATGETLSELERLRKLKREYYQGADVEIEIQETQLSIVRRHVDRLIKQAKKSSTEQSELFGEGVVEESNREDQDRIEALKETKSDLASIGVDGPFLWELDFAEVMLNGGFDIVIGNPPYVRRETLYPQDIDPERIDQMSDDEIKEIKNQYVADLRGYVQDRFDVKPGKWSDLYIYFFFRGQDILRENGSLIFVTSNSWLSSDYGEKLQEGILRYGNLKYVISNERQRTFEEAEVNTVITTISKTGEIDELSGTSSFITVKSSYSSIAEPASMRYLLHGGSDGNETKTINTEFRQKPVLVEEGSSQRRVTLSHESLWVLGGGTIQSSEIENSDNRVFSERHGIEGSQFKLSGYNQEDSLFATGSFEGDMNWSVFIRAPDVFFEAVQMALQYKLEEITDVHLGLNSGRNSFFYLTENEIEEHGIEEEFLTPLLKSPKEIETYSVEMDKLQYHVLDVQENREEIEGTNVIEYIKSGEEKGYHNKPFFRSKDKSNWYKKTMYDSKLVQPRDVGKRHFVAVNDNNVCVDVRLICIDPPEDTTLIWGYLNSSVGIFIKELFGRVGLGGGALENYVGDMKPMPVVDPDEVSDEDLEAIRNVMDEMQDREVRDVGVELGASESDSFQLDNVLDDRRKLDDVVMGDIMELSEFDQERVYKTTLEMVNARIDKSESV